MNFNQSKMAGALDSILRLWIFWLIANNTLLYYHGESNNMQQNYRNVPTTERQSFEIEGAHGRHDYQRSARPNLAIVTWIRRSVRPDLAIAAWLIFVFAVMVVVGHARAHASEGGGHKKAVHEIPTEIE
jgi:hypothetical protein